MKFPHFICKHDHLIWVEESMFIITLFVINFSDIWVCNEYLPYATLEQHTMLESSSFIITKTDFSCKSDRLNWIESISQSLLSLSLSVISWHLRWQWLLKICEFNDRTPCLKSNLLSSRWPIWVAKQLF